MKLDNYAISLFKTCPSKYMFRCTKSLVSQKANLPASFGIAIHVGLDELYKTHSLEEAIKAFKESWEPFEGLDLKGLYCLGRGGIILTNYNELMYLSGNDFVPLHIEVGMAAELNGSEHILTGRIDLIVKQDNEVIVVDNKTRSRSLSSFGMQPNYQLLGYSLGTKQTLNLKEYPPVMANLIKVSKSLNPDDFILRKIHYPSPSEMATFIEDTIYWIAKVEECTNFERFPKLGDGYKGCEGCEYNAICIAPQMEYHMIEEGLFKVEEWKPY